WIKTEKAYDTADAKRVYYLSAEFLMGRALANNLLNVGLYEKVRAVMEELGFALAELLEQEPDPGLGNGGLGRLAACFLDSMATLELPGFGDGLRYELAHLQQRLHDEL